MNKNDNLNINIHLFIHFIYLIKYFNNNTYNLYEY